MDTSCTLLRAARSSPHCRLTPPRLLRRLPHAHDPTLNSFIDELQDRRVALVLVLVEDPRIARDQTRLTDPAKKRPACRKRPSMESHIALSELLNMCESVGAQAGGPYIDHHDERAQAARLCGYAHGVNAYGHATRTSGRRGSTVAAGVPEGLQLRFSIRKLSSFHTPESPRHHPHLSFSLPPSSVLSNTSADSTQHSARTQLSFRSLAPYSCPGG